MRKIFFALFLSLVPSLLFSQLKNGYEIDITIHGLQDSTVFLAYHFGDKQFIKDTIRLNNAGHGIDVGQENLPQGIYMIVLPGRKYFEILISKNQHFALSCSYSDYFNTLKFTGSDENSAFVEYQKRWITMQQQTAVISKRVQNNKQNSDSLKILTSIQKLQEDNMKSYLISVIKNNNGNLLATLVKALLPPEIPEFSVSAGVANQDSVRWIRKYNYNKDHFFDNIDLTDERLLRTPILYARLEAFFTNVLIQSPDSINKEIDKIIQKCKSNHKVFQFVAVYLFNHFRESEIMGHDAVMVKLADDIYLSGKADWVSREFKDDLRKQIDLIRPNLIGKKAENLVMDSYKRIFVSLYDVEKDFTILYFWEPDCGHCKESTPKLKAYYDKVKDTGIEVFAVCTTTDKPKWTKYIEDNKLTWINGWDPERSSHFDYYYKVQSTPMVYILDKNKKNIAKKLAVEDIGPFIENYRKFIK
ncbi:MAG: thioredoxin-like domain-containing protein [Bacteroidia bacterium]|nr:thioredoxin-like domain-containing protein [Bacteroidia bacterium]